ncbi:hypothetical protein LCGC14_1366230 [marine sediment metagenome]|uniref:Uncharacterized protein n=1 Tax=marine sediment metagenome TaxID=412755 RepID=A0A0F9K6Q7_9ZZZZ
MLLSDEVRWVVIKKALETVEGKKALVQALMRSIPEDDIEKKIGNREKLNKFKLLDLEE